MMDYKEYYKSVEASVRKYSDVVFYQPLADAEIKDIEDKIGFTIKPLYREFLATFGLIQDVFPDLETDIDDLIDDTEFIQETYKGYLPITKEVDEEEIIFLINNNDPDDDYIYQVIVNEDEELSELERLSTFKHAIEEYMTFLHDVADERCPNTEKVNNLEITVTEESFKQFIDLFKVAGIEQLSEWSPKFNPENDFSTEVAKFKFYDTTIIVDKNEDEDEYKIEIEEPSLTKHSDSIIYSTLDLMDKNKIEYEKILLNLIESE